MNQILISEKVYVTPELKKKKRRYKIFFFVTILLVFILSSVYIYAEYDKSKNEEQSREILESFSFDDNLLDDTRIEFEDNATIVFLNAEDTDTVVLTSTFAETEVEVESEDGTIETVNVTTYQTSTGQEYWPIATINIPSIDCNYPVLNTWSDELLKISPCYYHGANPNTEGNFCIVGHNYRNNKFFSKVPNLEIGDAIEITDLTNNTVEYIVYDKYVVDEEDTACTSQLTDGRTEITLITCTNDGSQRHVIKAVKSDEYNLL